MINPDATITGEITSLAFGGQGILRHEGFVVFVPFTAIGDQIECRITHKKKRFAEGVLVKIIKPGPGRTVPACPYFGKCGGCQLQHLTYEKQLDYKKIAIDDSLTRIGHIGFNCQSVIPAEHHWAYRRHITLHLREENNVFVGGYIAIDNHSLLKVELCPIFVDKSDPVIRNVQELVKKLKAVPGNLGRVTIFKQHEHKFLLNFVFDKLPVNCQEVLHHAFENQKMWMGIEARSTVDSMAFGKTRGHLEIEGLTLQFNLNSFIQNHPEQSLKIYRKIVSYALSVGANRVVDLFCGIGVSSLMLAQQGMQVWGVEVNPDSIEIAKQNAANNELISVKFYAATVEKLLPQKLKEWTPDLVIINPPRQGMEPGSIEVLNKQPVDRIIYISCMPSTLARDLHLFSEIYEVESCEGVDMFPQTAHVESLTILRKKIV